MHDSPEAVAAESDAATLSSNGIVKGGDLDAQEVAMVVHGISPCYGDNLHPKRNGNGKRSSCVFEVKPQSVVYVVRVRDKEKWVYTEKCTNCLEDGHAWEPGSARVISCTRYDRFGSDAALFEKLKQKARKKGMILYPYMDPRERVRAFCCYPEEDQE